MEAAKTEKSFGLDNPGFVSDPTERGKTPEEETVSVVSRGNWANKWEFLLSCIGLSVGIGNVWRFPYLAYENGGGAFLVPYLIMLLLAGKPMYFLELAFGQYSGKSCLVVWSSVPLAKGVGFGMMTVCLIIVIYYNVVMAYTVFYIASTFQSVLPWSTCDAEWAVNTSCTLRSERTNRTGERKTPSQVYWERYVLDTTDGLWELGGIKWDLCLCLLLGWTVVAACLAKGIKSSGKVVYFAATFPYLVLAVLLICGLMQEGAVEGVLFFVTPEWSKLRRIEVWQAAAGQMFFSLSISMGALISYSSYNEYRNNIYRDALVVSVLDTVTSVVAGLVIFSVLGAMAHDLGVDVSEVVASGPGLAFVAYPEALTPLPVPQLWSFLFFFMLFILGLDSEFALLENILTSLADRFVVLRKHKTLFCLVTSCCCFFLGLPCVTRGGQYVLTLMDRYGGGTAVVFVAVCESIAVGWIYGSGRFCRDVERMLGTRPGWYWKITWTVSAPVVLTFVFVYSLIEHAPIHLEDPRFPPWANVLGWSLAGLAMIQIPLWAAVTVARQKTTGFLRKVKEAAKSSPEWGPNDPDLKREEKIHSEDGKIYSIHL
ncbi:sodium- and chloride-dependent glycine transporter 1-like [Centruroides vittatus]|uniref:sodium- and chloride-dependent glycine transporter 1-like n=1 Tax=Centruroides vittatus TaxID=120091 RepID=UPI00350F04FB